MIGEAALVIGYFLALTVAGFFWTLGLSGRRGAFSPALVAAAAFPAGAGLFALTGFTLMWLGCPFRPAAVLVLLGALALGGIGFCLVRRGRPGSSPVPTPWGGRQWVAAIVLLVLLGIQGRTLVTADYGGDGRAYWRLKAQVLSHEGTVRSPLLLHPRTHHTHKQYPLMVPVLQAGLMTLEPGLSQDGERAVYAAFLLGLFLLVYAGLRHHCTAFQSLLLLLVLTMATHDRLAGGYVTVALAVFLLGTLVFGLRWSEHGCTPSLWMSVLFAAGLVFTKSEGLLYFVILAALFGLTALKRRSRPDLARAAAFAGVTLLVSLPWLLFRRELPATFEDAYFEHFTLDRCLAGVSRVPYLLNMIAGDFLSVLNWGPVWVLGIWALWRTRLPLVLVLFPAAVLGLWLVINVVDPQGLHYYLNTSGRFLSCLAPLAILMAGRALSGKS